MIKKISLNGEYHLYTFENETAPKTPAELKKSRANYIIAKVPGNVELDYMRAGLFPDLYYGENIKLVKSLEDKDFWYETSFTVNAKQGDNVRLVFDGVDAIAEYFLNDKKIGESDNALIPHAFDVSNHIANGKNVLYVHIHSAVLYAKRYEISPYNVAFPECYESLNVRKSAACYGWDILPRVVSAGIWRNVTLEIVNGVEIKNCYISTCRVSDEIAVLVVSVNADVPYGKECILRIVGECVESKFIKEVPFLFNATTVYPYIENPKLWYPQGMGEQNLYDINIQLLYDKKVVAEKKLRYGIRKIEVKYTEEVDEKGNFCIYVNGKKCRIRGVDHTPIDVFHSKDKEKTAEIVESIADMNCNMVRIWGGGVYENDEFYDLCDEKGIMVWQDIMLACHSYPQTEEFLKKIAKECKAISQRLRNHSCIALWCGSNETDWAYVCVGLNPNSDKVTRIAIKDALYEDDPYRNYLPSTPYFSQRFVEKYGGQFYLDLKEIEDARRSLAEEHYWWHRNDFYSFKKMPHRFVAEIGYSSCPDKESVDKFLPQGYTFDSKVWECHSFPTEEGMNTGIEYLFNSVFDKVEDKIIASQIYQAEAYKYIVEQSRINKNNNGIMLWNLRDGFPIFSSSIIDYYGEKKFSYYAVKASYEPLQCIIDNEENDIFVYVVNDSTYIGAVLVSVKSVDGKILLKKKIKIKNGVTKIGEICKDKSKTIALQTELSFANKIVKNYAYCKNGKITYSEYDFKQLCF